MPASLSRLVSWPAGSLRPAGRQTTFVYVCVCVWCGCGVGLVLAPAWPVTDGQQLSTAQVNHCIALVCASAVNCIMLSISSSGLITAASVQLLELLFFQQNTAIVMLAACHWDTT